MARNNKSSSSISFIIFIVIILAIAFYAFNNRSLNEVQAISQNQVLTKDEVSNIVKDFIKNNPELMLRSIEDYQIKKMKEIEEKSKNIIKGKKNELEAPGTSPVFGSADPDVTIVQFADYACGYCKRADKTIAELMESDKKLKVIFKEFPILGEASKKAAKAALAVYEMNSTKYLKFHEGLMASTQINEREIDNVIANLANKLSLDLNKLKETMSKTSIDEELAKVKNLASQINIHGTPAFIIGEEILPGAVDLSVFQNKIAEIRSKNKSN